MGLGHERRKLDEVWFLGVRARWRLILCRMTFQRIESQSLKGDASYGDIFMMLVDPI